MNTKEYIGVIGKSLGKVLDSYCGALDNIFLFGQPARDKLKKQASLTPKQRWIIDNIETIKHNHEVEKAIASDWYHVWKDIENSGLASSISQAEMNRLEREYGPF